MTKRTAVVTGANRGIGFEICRQLAKAGLEVILTSRDPKKGVEAAEKLAKEGLSVTSHALDIKAIPTFRAAVAEISKKHGRIDVLVNNAGIFPEKTGSTTPEVFMDAFQTNSLGPYYLCEAVLPIMRENRYGRIVNLSSGMGQLSEMESGYPAYRLSKTALNAVTRIFAAEGEDFGVKVNSMCPGWVKTDMGGAGADRSVEKGAETAIWLATLPENGPTGGFFRDREPIAW